MKKKHIILIVAAAFIAVLVIVNIRARSGKALPVQVEQVQKRDISMVISASGSIRPRRQVDVSANSIGKITKVAVKEGDSVRKGQFLLQIDPVELESTVLQLEAALESARANERQMYAQVQKAERDLERTRKLFRQGYLTDQEVDEAKTLYEIAVTNHEAARHQIAQNEANLNRARHGLKEVTIMSEMGGIITRLNVEEGESAIMGTMNVPGTVLLTIADMSIIEAEVDVDETEVVNIEIGHKAKVTLDAFPDTSYRGEVTEIGNSPIYSSTASSQQGVDFNVVITILDAIENVRPGLSADAEITVAEREGVLSIPIQSLTVRREKELENSTARDSTEGVQNDGASDEIEGVFVIENGRALFKSVGVGISDQKYFEILFGLEEGDQVVSGNYRAIRDLRHKQRVKITQKIGKN